MLPRHFDKENNNLRGCFPPLISDHQIMGVYHIYSNSCPSPYKCPPCGANTLSFFLSCEIKSHMIVNHKILSQNGIDMFELFLHWLLQKKKKISSYAPSTIMLNFLCIYWNDIVYKVSIVSRFETTQ